MTAASDAIRSGRGYRFDSAEIRSEDRYSYWEDVVCSRLSPSKNQLLSSPESFAASIECNSIGNVDLCRMVTSPLVYVRSKKMISKLPNDDIFIACIEKGGGLIEQFGRQSLCSEGSIVVYDSGSPFYWHLAETTQMIIAMIPRSHVDDILPQFRRIAAVPIASDNMLAPAIRANISEMLRVDLEGNPLCSKRLGRSLSDTLICSVETVFFEASDSARHSGIVRRAKDFMRDHIDDPDLDLDKIAQHVGASRRTLARSFCAEGTTTMRWLWDERLAHAFFLLDQSKVGNVSQAVMRSGFNDFSHFSRSFRGKYGLSPRLVLKNACARSSAGRQAGTV